MRAYIIEHQNGRVRYCGQRCAKAKSKKCRCCCNGRNHGQARRQTQLDLLSHESEHEETK